MVATAVHGAGQSEEQGYSVYKIVQVHNQGTVTLTIPVIPLLRFANLPSTVSSCDRRRSHYVYMYIVASNICHNVAAPNPHSNHPGYGPAASIIHMLSSCLNLFMQKILSLYI